MLAALLGSVAAHLACSLIYPVGNLEGSADGGRVDAGACAGEGGPGAIRVEFDGGTFCIDSTEVTNQDYAAFLTAKGSDTSGQPPECAGNTTYVPSGACVTFGWPVPQSQLDDPVACVDWCDALAFCSWAGKRLCAPRVDALVARNEWYIACSRDGTRVYPYGNEYDAGACNGAGTATVAVRSLSGCVGGYDGLFDMSGNVSEWVDSCDDAGNCFHGGGGYETTSTPPEVALACDGGSFIGRMAIFTDVGFRCCTD